MDPELAPAAEPAPESDRLRLSDEQTRALMPLVGTILTSMLSATDGADGPALPLQHAIYAAGLAIKGVCSHSIVTGLADAEATKYAAVVALSSALMSATLIQVVASQEEFDAIAECEQQRGVAGNGLH